MFVGKMADNVESESLKAAFRRVSSNKRSISIDSNQNEVLDPRIYAELEKLNKTSEEINFLERDADQLRVFMQQTSAVSTQKLNALAQKLGSCVVKAKSYYEARIKLREIQIKAQGVAQRFETACSDLTLAKEMVRVAEDCYSALGCPDDSAWQEMLNHSTSKVNEAELERKKSELEHEKMTQICTEVQREVTTLQKEQKRSIAKSKPYFEMKAKINQEMEGNGKKLTELESLLAEAKSAYSSALQSLERISDEIHQNRQSRKRVSRHEELNHSVSDSKKTSSQTAIVTGGAEKESTEIRKKDSEDLCLAASAMHGCRDTYTEQNETDKTMKTDSVVKNETSSTGNVMSMTYQDPSDAIQSTRMLSERPELKQLLTPNDNESMNKSISTSGSGTLSKIPEICLSESHNIQESWNDPEVTLDPSRANAEVMQSIMRLKSTSISPPISFLNHGPNHLGDDNSDIESVTSSYANANVLSDEQIESLMLDTADYKKTLEKMNSTELGQFKALELPAKLSYLQDYVNFDPIWIEDDFDNFDKKARKFVVSESN